MQETLQRLPPYSLSRSRAVEIKVRSNNTLHMIKSLVENMLLPTATLFSYAVVWFVWLVVWWWSSWIPVWASSNLLIVFGRGWGRWSWCWSQSFLARATSLETVFKDLSLIRPNVCCPNCSSIAAPIPCLDSWLWWRDNHMTPIVLCQSDIAGSVLKDAGGYTSYRLLSNHLAVVAPIYSHDSWL